MRARVCFFSFAIPELYVDLAPKSNHRSLICLLPPPPPPESSPHLSITFCLTPLPPNPPSPQGGPSRCRITPIDREYWRCVTGGGRSSRSMETLTDSIRVDPRLNKRPVALVARGRRSDSPSSDSEESEESSPGPARPCRLLFDRRWEASMFGRHLRPTLSR